MKATKKTGAPSIDYYSPQFKSALDRLDRGKTYAHKGGHTILAKSPAEK